MSEFFFCGMMDEPVVYASESVTKPNSQLVQRMISSERRDRCIIRMDNALRNSAQKSRSDTPSSEFMQIPSKPSCAASMARLVG